MENSNDVLNGFSAFSASMAGTPGESSSASSTLGSIYDRNIDEDNDVSVFVDDNTNDDDPTDGKSLLELAKGNDKVDEKDKTDDVSDDTELETKKSKETKSTDDLDDSIDTTKKQKNEEVKDTNLTDDEITEAELVGSFTDLFAEELGWDIDEEEKPSSIKDLVNYMNNIIEENSKPKYASKEIAELDDYIKNGGDIKSYFDSILNTDLDLDNIDLEDTNNQTRIVRELLTAKGYNRDRINKMIHRYEDAGTLEDEASDAIEELKDFKEQQKEKLLEAQKEEYTNNLKAQQEFYKTVEKTVNEVDTIRGIPISKREKQALLDYVFRVEPDGTTRYQKDYMSSHKNLIESAFFTMKGDSLTKTIEQKATTNAVRDLKEKLRRNTKPARNSANIDNGSNDEGGLSVFEMLGRQINKPSI